MFDDCRSAAIIAFHDACHSLDAWPADDARARRQLAALAAKVGAGVGAGVAAAIEADGADAGGAWPWILANHRHNCSLWNEEDLARRTQAADADIALNKRRIDRFNQQRNDAMERIDDVLLGRVENTGVNRIPSARLSSETAGAMVDRLSILSLKIHHMGLQTRRADVEGAHHDACRAKLRQLETQRDDLAACLDRLLDEVLAGTAYFKIYRQFKMYNDPNLNPALVAERRQRGD
jgi:hypothetical protein